MPWRQVRDDGRIADRYAVEVIDETVDLDRLEEVRLVPFHDVAEVRLAPRRHDLGGLLRRQQHGVGDQLLEERRATHVLLVRMGIQDVADVLELVAGIDDALDGPRRQLGRGRVDQDVALVGGDQDRADGGMPDPPDVVDDPDRFAARLVGVIGAVRRIDAL